MQCEIGFTFDRPHFSWMRKHLSGWQFGESGLLWAICSQLGMDGECVEIGAGDGDSLPLTIDLFYRAKQPCVLYEIDPERGKKLAEKYPKAEVFGAFELKRSHPMEGLVVIDIDGQDSIVMRDVMDLGDPAVVMVEHMDRHYPVASGKSEPLPEWTLGLALTNDFYLQDTAETLHSMALERGYERIGYSRCNSIFVHSHFSNALYKEIGS
jgi:hypothetical protein